MSKTKIEWADQVWNPIVGCDGPFSPGCDHCYARRMAARLQGMGAYQQPFDQIVHQIHKTYYPRKIKRPTTFFVNSMGEMIPKEPAPLTLKYHHTMRGIWDIFSVMQECERHKFMILTKCPVRWADWDKITNPTWPENVWFGISAEDPYRLASRVHTLKELPARHKFISFEPLLGRISPKTLERMLRGHATAEGWRGIEWVIVGGETGPGARPMHPDWVREIRDTCVQNNVPFFFKGWGEWGPYTAPELSESRDLFNSWTHSFVTMFRVGKKRAGRELDGKEWNEYPWEGIE